MKKLLSTFGTALLLLSLSTAACADILVPEPGEVVQKSSPNVLPWILVGAAVIAAAVIIWRIRKKK